MLHVQPIDFDEACLFIGRLHRHHRPPLGYKVCIGANDGEKLVGVIVAGRPVARLLDDGMTMEVTRCCTDGTRNACSLLYSACWRACKAIGYRKMLTYTLPEEGGASLRAAGAVLAKMVDGGKWVKTIGGERVERANDWPTGTKFRWEWESTTAGDRFRVVPVVKQNCRTLFTDVEAVS